VVVWKELHKLDNEAYKFYVRKISIERKISGNDSGDSGEDEGVPDTKYPARSCSFTRFGRLKIRISDLLRVGMVH